MLIKEIQVKKFRQKIIQQLVEAKQKKLYWFKKEIALEGSLATCDYILNNKKKSKPPKEKSK